MKLRWLISYETFKFDTPDGDLHKGQYAQNGSTFYIRTKPENNAQFDVLNSLDSSNALSQIAGLQKVEILEGEKMYYDEFVLPNGRMLRLPSNQNKYRALGVKNSSQPEKEVSSQEIAEITKDDHKWQ